MENYKIGINNSEAKTVILNGIIETTGQVRFGDGTEINLTITEKDLVPTRDGEAVEKVVFAGSKRRGVDRRAAHEFRNEYIDFENSTEDNSPENDCYIPELCLKCPTCWIYGGTGSTSDTEIDYNIKSRVHYPTAYSIERSELAVATHSRNRVDERSNETGQAGIHEEEFIKGGVHFPISTIMKKMSDWEIGVYSQTFLDNINQSNYTAGASRQGGVKISTDRNDKAPILIVDVSETGTFPLPTFNISADIESFNEAFKEYKEKIQLTELKTDFENKGFEIEEEEKGFQIKDDDNKVMKIEKEDNVIKVTSNNDKVIMKRYIGSKALGYLQKRTNDYQQFLTSFNWGDWSTKRNDLEEYLGV
ncbi:type I-D CRISPR-associated protein Cas7/Csc2 [Sporohalobacter salinus]|uniref:type I-D CRISPR-associated protein Cas7/Csc2 n=1 Tax=Sporohalobacter salinus TaxID=1494606 RepID=UPI00196060BA|nr:type I-D CRISPR-associated protein Cas7/Csc2 [Sporohalobacter salinus]MBM7623685.1 CRISPR type I-D-associated protein Csc2 [Sporohalobacter salinus]